MGRKKQKNHIIADHGDHLEINISTPKFPDAVMLIDKPDWEAYLSIGCGRFSPSLEGKRNKTAYVITVINGKRHKVHRLIHPNSECVDHINRNGLDNRRVNLRECNRYENMRNCAIRTDNTSGFKGVAWSKKYKHWRSGIKLNGKLINLGGFGTPEEAHAAYCEASIKYHGEFGRVV